MNRPVLVIVSGPPGAGKSTLAKRLGAEVGLPVFDRDDFKDAMFEALGWSDREWSGRVGRASWDMMYLVAERALAAGTAIVLESNFSRVYHTERLAALAERFPFRLVEVFCFGDKRVFARRFRERWLDGGRHPGHASDADGLIEERVFLDHFAERDYRPLEQSEVVVRVDTTDFDGIDYEGIATAVRQALGEKDGPEDR